jgi:DNA-binding GntR family transcriptional regulator
MQLGPVPRVEQNADGAAVDLSVQVRDRIRGMLLAGQLRPGEPIRQELLAAELGVSRLPVRESLRMLAAEGVVVHKRHVGYAVARLTERELSECYMIRRCLETEALDRMDKLSDEQASTLRDVTLRMQRALEAGDVVESAALNRIFHFTMFANSGLSITLEVLDQIWLRSDRYRAIVLYDEESASRLGTEHEHMIQLAERGKIAELIAAMDEHRAVGEARVMRTLAQLKRYGADVS